MARYDLSRFRATHNSYSGGPRGSLPRQLDSGIRCIEFDFHDNGYDEIGDYRVGHLKPGMEVARGNGNPDSLLLKEWLEAIADWCDARPDGHTPITIVLDAKDDLMDNEDGGDLEDLNRTLEEIFGRKLFTRDDYDQLGGWPDVDTLRNRVLCVLSGHGGTRASYRWAFGAGPSMAVNSRGDVVLAYRSTAGDLNCWTGRAEAEARAVRWGRKTTYGLSSVGLSEPAVAVNDDGWVVTAHRFGPPLNFPGPLLESKVGRLQEDGRIAWFSGQTFGAGTAPSLQLNGDEVLEIHTVADGKRRQQVRGTLNRQKRRIEWGRAVQTEKSPFPRDQAQWNAQALRCSADPAGVILCGFDTSGPQPVRYRQVAFVEIQKGESAETIKDVLFFAAAADSGSAIAQARSRGLVARAWGFGENDRTGPPNPPQENIPATDSPDARDGAGVQWYQTYMTGEDVAI